MRRLAIPIVFLAASAAAYPQQAPAGATATTQSEQAPIRTVFHVRYISGTSVYIDGGRNSGLAEGTKLILKQDPKKPNGDPSNVALEPGIIAKLKVVSVASTSAVCEVEAKARDLAEGDAISLPQEEVANLVQKDTLGATRKYPMVVSFTQGDPLDEEVREAEPRPPLPEVNQIRGRLGFDVSSIQELGQNGANSSEYGFVFRADFTRIKGTYWNLNGYWRGTLQKGPSGTQQSLQNLLNRTYLMSLSYINPQSRWMAGIGRLFVPYAASLETIDGAYVSMKLTDRTLISTFGGSTPDPSAWNYNPKNKIGGAFLNFHGGSYDNFHYSSSGGAGVNMQQWSVNRPFLFTENEFSYKRYFSLFHSMQIDKPTANPGSTAVNMGLGQSLLSVRVQVHPRVTLDVSDTYFRDVPTYDPTLVGTGLLDKYLYQGVNGGARVTLPLHLTGYFSLGRSSSSSDKKDSLNQMFGATMTHIWKTGLMIDARYSKFDNSFSSGTYRALMLTRDLGERFRLNVQGGRYAYNSALASTNNSNFVNVMFDTNLGARMFVESAFTTQRGGSLNYNQWINTLGYRFDNRASHKIRP
ncbi:hypothetical protein DYQ86_25525 [Acidobacteria bacterium AB60]|nr:hypothetical protein DYQ86_25525 [Acidobacteria bacterium AB60]